MSEEESLASVEVIEVDARVIDDDEPDQERVGSWHVSRDQVLRQTEEWLEQIGAIKFGGWSGWS